MTESIQSPSNAKSDVPLERHLLSSPTASSPSAAHHTLNGSAPVKTNKHDTPLPTLLPALPASSPPSQLVGVAVLLHSLLAHSIHPPRHQAHSPPQRPLGLLPIRARGRSLRSIQTALAGRTGEGKGNRRTAKARCRAPWHGRMAVPIRQHRLRMGAHRPAAGTSVPQSARHVQRPSADSCRRLRSCAATMGWLQVGRNDVRLVHRHHTVQLPLLPSHPTHIPPCPCSPHATHIP